MMGRGLKILLALSLLLNGFLAGVVAMGGLHLFPHHRVMVMDRGAGMFRDTRVLSEEGREAFHEVFRGKRGDLRPGFQQMRRLREELGAALAADPWDRARVVKVVDDLRAIETSHQTAFSMTLIDAFEKLSAADRKALVEAANSREKDMRERRRWRKERGERERGEREEGPAGPPPERLGPPEDAPPADEEPAEAPPPD